MADEKETQPERAPVRGVQGYSVDAKRRGSGSAAKAPKAASGGGGSRLPLYLGGALLLAAVAVGVIVLATRGGGNDAPSVETAAAAAGCKLQTFPATGTNDHLAEGEKPPTYDSDPPTHGKHAATPPIWGYYEQEVPQESLVHTLEHGGLVIQYGDKVPADQVQALLADVRKDTEYTILASYPKLGSTIAYTYWTKLLTCPKYDPQVLAATRGWRQTPPAPEIPQPPWSDLPRQNGW